MTLSFFINKKYCVYVCITYVLGGVCQGAHVEIERQFCGVSILLTHLRVCCSVQTQVTRSSLSRLASLTLN